MRYGLHRRLGASTITTRTKWGVKLNLRYEDGNTFEMYWGVYEEEEVEKFFKYIKHGMTVLDVGAHIGYFTLLMAHLVGRDGVVFAFEPHPET